MKSILGKCSPNLLNDYCFIFRLVPTTQDIQLEFLSQMKREKSVKSTFKHYKREQALL